MSRIVSSSTLSIVLSFIAAAWPCLVQAQHRIEITVNGVGPPLVVIDEGPGDVANGAGSVASVLNGVFNGVRVRNLRLEGQRGAGFAAIYLTSAFPGALEGSLQNAAGPVDPATIFIEVRHFFDVISPSVSAAALNGTYQNTNLGAAVCTFADVFWNGSAGNLPLVMDEPPAVNFPVGFPWHVDTGPFLPSGAVSDQYSRLEVTVGADGDAVTLPSSLEMHTRDPSGGSVPVPALPIPALVTLACLAAVCASLILRRR